jgi:anaerobic magnesium-protoporphyrin IX monomethyl ester cyclase
MRLTLVMPTGLRVGYDEFFSSAPLGIESLAGAVRDLAEVSLLDMRGRGTDISAHAGEILATKPDLVGLSINSAPHTNYSVSLAAELKRRQPDLTLFMGGQQVTFLADQMLATGDVDAVLRGEGEVTLAEVLRASGRFEGIAGVSWVRDGTVVHEPDRPQIENIDELALPALDLLADRDRYRMGAYRVEGIETSRGCPFNCSFCSVRNFHRGKWRPKSASRVLAEIDDVLARFGDEKMVIYFADDNFAHDIHRVEEICNSILERNTRAYFWCQARVDTLSKNPDLVALMGRAHFAAVLVGVETPVERLLKASRKGTNVEQVHRAIELLHQHDIGVWGTFTLGLPDETPEESRISAAFIPTVPADVIQITVATPIPGSTLYDDAVAENLIIEHDWDNYDFSSPTMIGQMAKPEMDNLLNLAYLKSYLSRRFFRSLFSQKTNLNRLRRTALKVFWTFLWRIAKENLRNLVRRKPAAPAVDQSIKKITAGSADDDAPQS